ncbi:MAG TPA: hypothetical protein VFB38_10530 [Chthonomonadaceae bacterium]|nr:hypothetical protein [Chthonomonadaceae bacterium]
MKNLFVTLTVAALLFGVAGASLAKGDHGKKATTVAAKTDKKHAKSMHKAGKMTTKGAKKGGKMGAHKAGSKK